MTQPRVTVIIPTYNGAQFLGDAIRSVLDQTWQDFELIVVNDASPDKTQEVVARFKDPRIRLIRHETNQGVSNARKTGVEASRGEIIVHLDQDDYFHPDKLRIHVEYLDAHPDVGFTYNSRFELYPTSGEVREILRPSPNLTLTDLVLSFPLAPSVWVQRREWALREDIWEEKTFYRGREIVICGRLYMAGCKFALIDRVLNYRRYHRDREVKNIARQCEAERTCQQIIFDDPRCPPEVLALKEIAFSNIYAMWMAVAFRQKEYELGSKFLLEAVTLNPTLLEGVPPKLVNDLVIESIDDEGESLESFLMSVFENLPQRLLALKKYYPWAKARGYLMQGVRAVLWDRPADIKKYFSKISSLTDQIDAGFIQWMTSHLLAYETEFGTRKSLKAIIRLAIQLERLGMPMAHQKIRGAFFASKVFESFNMGNLETARMSIVRAFLNDPSLLTNKGLISLFLQTLPAYQRLVG